MLKLACGYTLLNVAMNFKHTSGGIERLGVNLKHAILLNFIDLTAFQSLLVVVREDMVDLCQWRASIGLFHSSYSDCSSLKRSRAASNPLWFLLAAYAIAFLCLLWSVLKQGLRRTSIAAPSISGME